MKQNEDINDLLARHLAHESMTDGQQQQLDAWIEAHPTEYRQLKRLTDALRPQADEASFDARRAWLKVEPRLKGKTVELHRKRRFVTFCSIAASLLLLLATATIYLLERPAVHYVNNGRTARHLLLPDSSEVTLYPKTTLSFRYGAHRSERLARLEGKAFFHVKKAGGKPFRVETEEVEVEVLGTSFLVDATHTERTAVFVESGHVKVTADENDLELHAHEKAELSDGSLQKGVIDDPATFFNHKKPKDGVQPNAHRRRYKGSGEADRHPHRAGTGCGRKHRHHPHRPGQCREHRGGTGLPLRMQVRHAETWKTLPATL